MNNLEKTEALYRKAWVQSRLTVQDYEEFRRALRQGVEDSTAGPIALDAPERIVDRLADSGFHILKENN